MGPQEGEKDWVDVANDLFNKCHVNLRLRKLTDCDAQVFTALYENILGEKVPDYIAEPCSQEDDVHNVQSVIDSLSLDYLQISLSHITGENVVRGDKESIKNLLEIFDGLVEYLNEEINEESQIIEREQTDKLTENVFNQSNESTSYTIKEHKEGVSSPSTEESVSQASKNSLSHWNKETDRPSVPTFGSEDTPSMFTGKQEGLASHPHASVAIDGSGPLDAQDAVTEPVHLAVALKPPNQSQTLYTPQTDSRPLMHTANGAGVSSEQTEESLRNVSTEIPKPADQTAVTNGFLSPPSSQSADVAEESLPSHHRATASVVEDSLGQTNTVPRWSLLLNHPDECFIPEQNGATSTSPPDTDEEREDYLRNNRIFQGKRSHHMKDHSKLPEERFKDPPLYCRQRNRKAEEELHLISENLSHRLEELDEMLKRVLEEAGEDSEVREADTECHRSSRGHMGVSFFLPGEPENATAAGSSLDERRQTNLTVTDHSKRDKSGHKPSHRNHIKHPRNKAYEEELKRFEDKKRAALDEAHLTAQEEQEYCETMEKDVPQLFSGSKKVHRKSRQTQTGSVMRRHNLPRNAPSINVRENELLPVLLKEMPHLQISPEALGRMWEQQLQQVDRLHSMSLSQSQNHHKLISQLEEERRKHDLLVEITRKERDHNRRLREFKEHIQQQRSSQNRLKEQRQQIARAKKYHREYHVQHRARLMRARTKEEKMFQNLFKEGLEIQKARLREQRTYAKEQQLESQKRHQDRMTSMENYYKDQFSLLADRLAQEQQEIQVRKKAQEKALQKLKRELRSRMERDITELQKVIVRNDEDDYFEDLEVQSLRNRISRASFKTSPRP
ncbi:centrosomal protein of 95 kDa isoform X2 [Cynoglossus semilaevis]|uniref:centrosomal protein of 95 kDa isoform X2 n=1 Tax=Cynoglossus semilaevis TaxID=244447 RepID=UPI0007DC8371|nr:centrosomal protein of 95 kDa isoform X2 [Cynoglossus semilaevis]